MASRKVFNQESQGLKVIFSGQSEFTLLSFMIYSMFGILRKVSCVHEHFNICGNSN